MQVLGNVVMVEILEKRKTDSGLIIPESIDQSGEAKVKVAYVGDECKKVKAGDFVLVDPMRLPQFMYQIDGKKYYCLYEHAIVAVITEQTKIDFLVREMEEEAK